MSTYFVLEPDDSGWVRKNRFSFDGSHRLSLPGVRCPSCGGWAVTGLHYPTVDLSNTNIATQLSEARAVDVSSYLALSNELRSVIGSDLRLLPGTTFGPTRGVAKGTAPDCIWLTRKTLLFARAAYESMVAAGFVLTGVFADIKLVGKGTSSVIEYFEPEARATAGLVVGERPPPCGICGREEYTWPSKIVLDAQRLDPSAPIQRAVEFPAILICNQELANHIRSSGLTNILAKSVELRS